MIKATSDAAFIVEFEASTAPRDVLGPNGLGTRIRDACISDGNYIYIIHESWRDGRFRYIFRETDRTEVVRRFATLGIIVPTK